MKAISEMQFQELANELDIAGHEWATAKAEYEYLDNRTKYILSLGRPSAGTEGEKVAQSYTNQEYLNHIELLKKAREKEIGLKMRVDAINMKHEYCRSHNSIKRAEMNIL